MASTRKTAVARHRRRMQRRGLVRVEVQVCKEDAPLLRSVAGALSDPVLAAETRALLRERFPSRAVKGLKALLADAPLDGINLKRVRDTGRTNEL
jgi:hypothetical protein